jgi:transcriptional regulator with XRE-family HTH domain
VRRPDLILLGKNIRKLRLDRELVQEDLAHLANLHPTYVAGIERGERNVGVLNLIKLARALNVEPGVFFEGIRTIRAGHRPSRA